MSCTAVSAIHFPSPIFQNELDAWPSPRHWLGCTLARGDLGYLSFSNWSKARTPSTQGLCPTHATESQTHDAGTPCATIVTIRPCVSGKANSTSGLIRPTRLARPSQGIDRCNSRSSMRPTRGQPRKCQHHLNRLPSPTCVTGENASDGADLFDSPEICLGYPGLPDGAVSCFPPLWWLGYCLTRPPPVSARLRGHGGTCSSSLSARLRPGSSPSCPSRETDGTRAAVRTKCADRRETKERAAGKSGLCGWSVRKRQARLMDNVSLYPKGGMRTRGFRKPSFPAA